MTTTDMVITGWAFIIGSLMLWFGQVLLPVKIGTFFKPDDFARVRKRFHAWIWLYRVHLFGYMVTFMAFVALAALISASASGVMVWPAVAVVGAGLAVSALAHAFYYHFGAWGALECENKSETQVHAYVDSLKVTTEYITCWVRFGRVFFGLGALVLSIGLMVMGLFPLWFAIALAVLGIAPIAVTMAFPDNLEYYHPIFHLQIVWLIAAGVLLILG